MTAEASSEFFPSSGDGFCMVELRDSEDSPARGVGVVSCTVRSLEWEAEGNRHRCSLNLHLTTIGEDGAENAVDVHVNGVPAALLWRTMPDDGDVEDAARSCLAKARAQGMHVQVPWVSTGCMIEKTFLSDSVEEFQLAAAARRRCRGPPIIPVKMVAAGEKVLADMGVLDLIAPYLESQRDKCSLGAVSRSLRRACMESKEMNRIVEAKIKTLEGHHSLKLWLKPQRLAAIEELCIGRNSEDSEEYDPALYSDLLRQLTSVRKFDCFGVSCPPPTEFWNLRQLENLSIIGNFDNVSGEIGNLQRLTSLTIGANSTSLPPELGLLTSLRTLDLALNEDLESLPRELGHLSMLEYLDLEGCDKLQTIEPVCMMTSLTRLNLVYCFGLPTLPSDISQLKYLKSIDMYDCTGLQTLPAEISGLESLETLSLVGCEQLRSIPPEIGMLKSLKNLFVTSSENLQLVPAEVGNLTSLLDLDFARCKQLQSLPPEISLLSALTSLDISNTGIESFPLEIPRLRALKKLKTTSLSIRSIPEELGFLTSLESLKLSECRTLIHLPNSIGHLQQLTLLDLSKCIELEFLPVELSKLMALKKLNVSGCESVTFVPPELLCLGQRPGLELILE